MAPRRRGQVDTPPNDAQESAPNALEVDLLRACEPPGPGIVSVVATPAEEGDFDEEIVEVYARGIFKARQEARGPKPFGSHKSKATITTRGICPRSTTRRGCLLPGPRTVNSTRAWRKLGATGVEMRRGRLLPRWCSPVAFPSWSSKGKVRWQLGATCF